ncbi:hypothetical protein K1T71_001578 [Dendrolimus kikuchii]|uniref:Uncharacterized protein n=1 Tax=Dendrolimus kikuchii TaxID=765133 RepID=A0ACC1DE19_9NEOP|nr:hypothetical protein K1T71_001578 [Dendrolimus kikuchii]
MKPNRDFKRARIHIINSVNIDVIMRVHSFFIVTLVHLVFGDYEYKNQEGPVLYDAYFGKPITEKRSNYLASVVNGTRFNAIDWQNNLLQLGYVKLRRAYKRASTRIIICIAD